ncbi:YDG/SRA domain-containing protein [Streptomyces sp. NPDC088725]|uniref:YDG/SRA domain-containing protein n=1 Tax=Streptomyces sp. NPDC088725 TaxID=3365873 RepID=UPI0037F6530A
MPVHALRELLLRARTARKGERARVRELATALPESASLSTAEPPNLPPGYGEVAGVPPGRRFSNRQALREAGLHRPLMASISGTERFGAESIIAREEHTGINEQPNSDLIYTGEGGEGDQQLTRGNAALATSASTRIPVRVVRRTDDGGSTAYRYEGLYTVDDYWSQEGLDARRVWQFRLVRLSHRTSIDTGSSVETRRSPLLIQRVVRSTAVARSVKEIHDFTCQVCGTRLTLQDGQAYAESAHIRPLGMGGQDSLSNVLCLCANCHVLMNTGTLLINDDLTVVNRTDNTMRGVIREIPSHQIDRESIAYHRIQHGNTE